MDRATRLWMSLAIVDRAREYRKPAIDDLFAAMDRIERRRGLVPKLTDLEKAAVRVAEAKLARGERLPEFALTGPVEDYLPESRESLLSRLMELPEEEQNTIWAMVQVLIDIDTPPLRLSPAEVAAVNQARKGSPTKKGRERR